VPGETVLIVAAVYAGAGRMSIVAIALIALLDAITGGHHRLGDRPARRAPAPRPIRPVRAAHAARVARAEEFFARHGNKIVPVARFFDGLPRPMASIAGWRACHFRDS